MPTITHNTAWVAKQPLLLHRVFLTLLPVLILNSKKGTADWAFPLATDVAGVLIWMAGFGIEVGVNDAGHAASAPHRKAGQGRGRRA
jgi:hypothetical protein